MVVPADELTRTDVMDAPKTMPGFSSVDMLVGPVTLVTMFTGLGENGANGDVLVVVSATAVVDASSVTVAGVGWGGVDIVAIGFVWRFVAIAIGALVCGAIVAGMGFVWGGVIVSVELMASTVGSSPAPVSLPLSQVVTPLKILKYPDDSELGVLQIQVGLSSVDDVAAAAGSCVSLVSAFVTHVELKSSSDETLSALSRSSSVHPDTYGTPPNIPLHSVVPKKNELLSTNLPLQKLKHSASFTASKASVLKEVMEIADEKGRRQTIRTGPRPDQCCLKTYREKAAIKSGHMFVYFGLLHMDSTTVGRAKPMRVLMIAGIAQSSRRQTTHLDERDAVVGGRVVHSCMATENDCPHKCIGKLLVNTK